MKHMNPKIEKLLREGFTMKTLSSFNQKQIDVLYKKLVSEQTKTVSTKYNLGDKKQLDAFVAAPNKKPENTSYDASTDTATVTGEGEITEKSVSKKQHGLMGAAYAVEKGDKELKDIPKSYRGKVEKLTKSMDKKQLKDFAKTKEKGLPEKKEEVKKLEESIMKLIDKHFNPETTKGDLLKTIKGYKR